SEPLLLDALLPISIVTHTGNAIASPRLRPRFLFCLLREKKHDLGPLRSGDMDFGLSTYYPIFLYLSLIILFAVGSIFAAHVIAPRKRTPIKLMTYESGMDPIGDARQRFDVKFYLMAILFLVFDVELLFLYPWAVSAYREEALLSEGLGIYVFGEVMV